MEIGDLLRARLGGFLARIIADEGTTDHVWLVVQATRLSAALDAAPETGARLLKDAVSICADIDALDWRIGHELTEDNSEQLDRIQRDARRVLEAARVLDAARAARAGAQTMTLSLKDAIERLHEDRTVVQAFADALLRRLHVRHPDITLEDITLQIEVRQSGGAGPPSA
jgi:hypothetical protein